MKVAFLTAGGIAPCLSASIGRLIKKYSDEDKSIEMMGYLHGYKGLLTGNSITMKIMDFYLHDEGLIRENWVPIDILHILKQIDVDVIQMIREKNK